MDSETDATDIDIHAGSRLRNKKLLRWLAGIFLGLLVVVAAFCLVCNHWVISSARPHIIHEISDLPDNAVGLVLGTSTFTRTGATNRLFDTRMWAAVNLYNLGKVKHLLVSGANPDETYNEPRKMYRALVRNDVPEEAITMDFAGFRTLDSVARAKKVFGLESYTIISQEFHVYRAVYLAHELGMDAVAFAVPEQKEGQNLRTELREFFARVRAVLDIHVFYTQPRFLGEPIQLPIEQD